jgi:hypothetical protein
MTVAAATPRCGLREGDLPPDAVGGPEDLPSRELAQHHDARRAGAITIVEAAPAKDFDPQRAEERRRARDCGHRQGVDLSSARLFHRRE